MGCPLSSLLATSLSLAGMVAQAPQDEDRPFCRFVERADRGQLEVAIATYRKGDATVTLHAAVHVADADHYATLQKRFESFDALLYELIADPALRPHPGSGFAQGDWVSRLQSDMGQGLRLASQMESLDYRRTNFVHADMTREQWKAALERSGRSWLGDLLHASLREPDREAQARQRKLDLVAAFRNGRGVHETRIMAARWITERLGRRREPTAIVEGRNEQCLAVLQQQIEAGKKNVGIYFGAAHMAHLERRLVKDLGWQRTDEQWIVAWDCRASLLPTVEKGLQRKRYRAKRDLENLTRVIGTWRAVTSDEQPMWDALRAAQADQKLPSRDPWGRDYLLRKTKDGFEARCLGSDGVADTEDDVATWTAASVPVAFDSADLDAMLDSFAERVRTAQADARRSAILATVTSLRNAAELHWARHGHQPSLAQLADPDAVGPGPGPKDPWGNDYVLRAEDRPGKFLVLSAGPDGKLDTTDDIASPTAR